MSDVILQPPDEEALVLFTKTQDEKRRELRKMRLLAVSLLIGAAALFVIALGREGFWWGLLKAVTEASMVGALADWFAVTALFRHPMGIPIPHTAIIPHNKQRIGKSLGYFVHQHFLKPEYIKDELARFDLARSIGEWLKNPENTDRVAAFLFENAPRVVERLNDDRIKAFLQRNVAGRIRKAELAPIVRRAIQPMLTDDTPDRVIQSLLEAADQFVLEHQETLAESIGRNVPSFARFLGLPDMAVGRLSKTLSQMAADPADPLRLEMKTALLEVLRRKLDGEGGDGWINDIKSRIAGHPELREAVSDAWTRLLAYLRDDLQSENSQIRLRLKQLASEIGEQMQKDEAFRTAVNEGVQDAAVALVKSHGVFLAQLIENKVAEWDDRDAVERIELNVGKDLQYIRINGTLVGGLVGGLLYLITHFTPTF